MVVKVTKVWVFFRSFGPKAHLLAKSREYRAVNNGRRAWPSFALYYIVCIHASIWKIMRTQNSSPFYCPHSNTMPSGKIMAALCTDWTNIRNIGSYARLFKILFFFVVVFCLHTCLHFENHAHPKFIPPFTVRIQTLCLLAKLWETLNLFGAALWHMNITPALDRGQTTTLVVKLTQNDDGEFHDTLKTVTFAAWRNLHSDPSHAGVPGTHLVRLWDPSSTGLPGTRQVHLRGPIGCMASWDSPGVSGPLDLETFDKTIPWNPSGARFYDNGNPQTHLVQELLITRFS